MLTLEASLSVCGPRYHYQLEVMESAPIYGTLICEVTHLLPNLLHPATIADASLLHVPASSSSLEEAYSRRPSA